jgi:glycosyltransferase involved in cell wall biosynthesis
MAEPRVAVVHKTFGNGGAELTCLHTIAALDDDFDLTLITDREVSPERISTYFGLDPDFSFAVKPYDRSVVSTLQHLTGFGFHHLQTTALERWLDGTDYDLYVSTKNELRLPEPAIQYVHFPYVINKQQLEEQDQLMYDWQGDWSAKTVYKRAWATLFFEETILSKPRTRVLTNSMRTKRLTDEVYGTDAKVVSPPVQDDFSPPPWEDQRSGVIAIPGRLSASKRIDRLIGIAEELPSDSNLDLHIVGAIPDTDYADHIQTRAPETVTFEGEVSRARLQELLEINRYGLQARDENFGIALAEMVYADCIPFAVDCEPFQELLQSPKLIFETATEAAKSLTSVSMSPERQRSLRSKLESIDKPYHPETFRNRISRESKDLVELEDY